VVSIRIFCSFILIALGLVDWPYLDCGIIRNV